jgi:drug/metabolite transporter (DMT)-like permease
LNYDSFAKKLFLKKNINLIYLIVLALIWGSSFILMKHSLFDSYGNMLFSPFQVATLRMTIASAVLLPVAIINYKLLFGKNFLALFCVGFFGNCLPAFLFSYAQTKLDSSVAGMLNSLSPLFTLVIGVMFFKISVKSNQIYGLLIGFSGALGLIFSNYSPSNSINIQSASLIVLATAFYGFSLNIVKKYLNEIPSIQITSLALICIGPAACIYLFSTDFLVTITKNPEGLKGLGAVSLLAVFGTAMALVIFNTLVKRVDALYAASVTYLMPVVAILWGILDNETPKLVQLFFILVILVGIYIVNLSNKKNAD